MALHKCFHLLTYLPIYLCFKFNRHFPGEPWLADSSSVSSSTCSRKNLGRWETQIFTGWMAILSLNQQCQSTEGKTEITMRF